jgi:hypothetical protein
MLAREAATLNPLGAERGFRLIGALNTSITGTQQRTGARRLAIEVLLQIRQVSGKFKKPVGVDCFAGRFRRAKRKFILVAKPFRKTNIQN